MYLSYNSKQELLNENYVPRQELGNMVNSPCHTPLPEVSGEGGGCEGLKAVNLSLKSTAMQ